MCLIIWLPRVFVAAHRIFVAILMVADAGCASEQRMPHEARLERRRGCLRAGGGAGAMLARPPLPSPEHT